MLMKKGRYELGKPPASLKCDLDHKNDGLKAQKRLFLE